MSNDEILKKLEELYREIQQNPLCRNIDPKKVIRCSKAVNLPADVVIISQALAEDTQRLSGVQFFYTDGTIGCTGCTLERFLNKFNRTVYPSSSIKLESGSIIPQRKKECTDGSTVYNTDVVPGYPGAYKITDGKMRDWLKVGYVEREMELINPKLVILMGRKSRDSFFEHFKENLTDKCWHKGIGLQEHINHIVEQASLPVFRSDKVTAKVCPIQHASGANNGGFPKMLKNDNIEDLINLLKDALNQV